MAVDDLGITASGIDGGLHRHVHLQFAAFSGVCGQREVGAGKLFLMLLPTSCRCLKRARWLRPWLIVRRNRFWLQPWLIDYFTYLLDFYYGYLHLFAVNNDFALFVVLLLPPIIQNGYTVTGNSGQECLQRTFLTPFWENPMYFGMLAVGLIGIWIVVMLWWVFC